MSLSFCFVEISGYMNVDIFFIMILVLIAVSSFLFIRTPSLFFLPGLSERSTDILES